MARIRRVNSFIKLGRSLGILKKPVVKKRGGKKHFVFSVDDSDIQASLKAFATSINKDMAQQMNTMGVASQVAKNVVSRLSSRYPVDMLPVRSGRLDLLKSIIGQSASVKTTMPSGSITASGRLSRPKMLGVVPRNIQVQVGDTNMLDTKTRLSVLDRSLPLKHIASFDGNPVKNNSSSAPNRYQLWRLLEFPRKSSYIIGPTNHIFLKYTTRSDGYSNYHYKTSVRWRFTKMTPKSYYWFLTESRELHNEDKNVISTGVSTVLNNLIAKSRFHQ